MIRLLITVEDEEQVDDILSVLREAEEDGILSFSFSVRRLEPGELENESVFYVNQ